MRIAFSLHRRTNEEFEAALMGELLDILNQEDAESGKRYTFG
jgi:hypothetical protein